jgi:hypothetical protein
MMFDVCAATGGRLTRVAITIAKNSKAAPRYHGAPGGFQPRSLSIKNANVKVKSPGPIITAIARKLLIARWISPCSDLLTRRVIIPFAAGLAIVQIIAGMESR